MTIVRTITDPLFWTTTTGAVAQVASTLLALFQKKSGNDGKDLQRATVELFMKMGNPIEHMDAWKKMHKTLQKAQNDLKKISEIIAPLGEVTAIEQLKSLKMAWRGYERDVYLPAIHSGFSKRESDVVQYVIIDRRKGDWRKSLEICRVKVNECFSEDSAKTNAWGAVRALRDFEGLLIQSLSEADSALIEGISEFSAMWNRTVGTLQGADAVV